MRSFVSLIAAVISVSSACAAQSTIGTAATVVRGPLGARLDSSLSKAAKEGFSGVALVEKDGDVILRKGYGLANRARKIPMTPATVVQIGSNTKDFTAVAIMQLAERGRLSLDDSIGKFFRAVPSDKSGITIRQILTHRAGLPEYGGGDFAAVTRDEEIRHALDAPLKFEPGKGRAYSNVGFSLLGAIIEQLSRKSYDEYVRDEILKPIGLRETGFLLPRYDDRRLAHGYRGDEDRGTMISKPHAPDGPYWNLRANGGMLSTVSEMYRFYEALYGTPLLKPATREFLFPAGQPIALAGSDMVSSFLYTREPRDGVTIIVASNSSTMSADRARDRLAPLLGLETNDRPVREVETGGPQGQTAGATLSELPDTPAGRRVRSYLASYNSGDTAAMRPFIRDSVIQAPNDKRSLDERLQGYLRIHDDLGTLKLVGVVSSTPTRIVAQMVGDHGGQVTMTFDIEGVAPYRLRGIRVEAQ